MHVCRSLRRFPVDLEGCFRTYLHSCQIVQPPRVRWVNGADTAASIYAVIESCKKVGLQPSQCLKYLIEERWFGEIPKTPLELSLKKLGTNKKVKFPKKSAWQI